MAEPLVVASESYPSRGVLSIQGRVENEERPCVARREMAFISNQRGGVSRFERENAFFIILLDVSEERKIWKRVKKSC